MSDFKVTCTNIDCPERQGGECQMANDPRVAETAFLYESNAIEGIFDDVSLKQAERAWKYLKSEDVLTSGVILKTHKILMLHQPLRPNEKGYWRRENVQVGGYIALSWQSVPAAMHEWVEDVKVTLKVAGEGGSNIKIDHIQFEKIHPFIDGNGRVGRMLLNWERLKTGLPLLIIYESTKHKYYDWFK